MGLIENFLKVVSVFQYKYKKQIAIAVIFFTIFMIFGISKLELQTDLNKEMPQDMEIYKLNDKINSKFGGQDVILILIMLNDDSSNRDIIDDIRNPDVFRYLIELEDELNKESSIESVIDAATYVRDYPLDTSEQVENILKNVPQANQFISDDYKTTMVMVKADVGSSEEKIISLTNLIDSKLKSIPIPKGVKTTVTGTPSIRVTMFDLLGHDAIFTILVASFIIFILLIIMERSLTKTILIFVPLVIGLIGTMGTLGWIGMKISVATAGLGAMILGLGVEYGVFMYTRYKEEKDKGKSQRDSLSVSVPSVGSAIIGSSTTTIIGFLALTLSVLPMLQHLGISLALGIGFCLFAAVFIEPVVILLEEDFEDWFNDIMYKKYSKKKVTKH
jgi:hydrophobe/amphiphile efflux-3 (HAE3) family protein